MRKPTFKLIGVYEIMYLKYSVLDPKKLTVPMFHKNVTKSMAKVDKYTMEPPSPIISKKMNGHLA